jgi:hypothetical protein
LQDCAGAVIPAAAVVVCGSDRIHVLMHSTGSSRYHGCETCRFFDLPHGMSLGEVAAIIEPTERTEHCEPMNGALPIEDRAICYITSRGR